MANKRTHEFTITVTFDKPCTVSWAKQEVRDNIHGQFYPFQRAGPEHGRWARNGMDWIFDDPGTFNVRSIK